MSLAKVRENLRELVGELEVALIEFDDQDDGMPGRDFWDMVEAIVDYAAEVDVPREFRPTFEAIAVLADALNQYDESDVDQNPADVIQCARRVIEAMVNLERPTERPPRESIKELADQKVSWEQIASIWGLFDRQGNPAGWKAQQELEEPGKWTIQCKDWIDPDEKEQVIKDQAMQKRMARIRSRRTTIRTTAALADAPCAETPYELFVQHVSPQQSARMLQRPPEDIADLWRLFAAGSTPDDPADAGEQWEMLAVMRRELQGKRDAKASRQTSAVETTGNPEGKEPPKPEGKQPEDKQPPADDKSGQVSNEEQRILDLVLRLHAAGSTPAQIAKAASKELRRNVTVKVVEEFLASVADDDDA